MRALAPAGAPRRARTAVGGARGATVRAGAPRGARAALRALAVGVVCLAALAAAAAPASAAAALGADAEGWVTVWTASPQAAAGPFAQQTLRLVVSPHGTGSVLRVRLTNRYATSPVTFAEVHVGWRAEGAALVAGTNRPVLFGGERTVTVPAGGTAISDAVRLDVRPFQDLAVSLRVDEQTGPAPMHLLALQTSYLTPRGSTARGDEEDGAAYTQTTGSLYFLAALDVRAGRTDGAIGVVGDSITDGVASTPGENRRWPDLLQRRLLSDPRLARLAVLNAGISGNQVTRAHPAFGAAAVDRIEPDLLELSGLRAVVFLEGINDIAGNTPPRATAEEIIAGYRRLIAAARERGLPVMALTLTPTAPNPLYPGHTDTRAAAVRRAVNDWLRSSGELDAVFDAEAALLDPAGTGILDPAFDVGDGLHPNDQGMRAIAGAVRLDELRPLACRRPVPPLAPRSSGACRPPLPRLRRAPG